VLDHAAAMSLIERPEARSNEPLDVWDEAESSSAPPPPVKLSTCTTDILTVVWFYERQGSFLRFETRDVPDRAQTFELVVVQPDGTESIERFADSHTLLRRQAELELTLASGGWQGPFGRVF
jgi:hypothetical protein